MSEWAKASAREYPLQDGFAIVPITCSTTHENVETFGLVDTGAGRSVVCASVIEEIKAPIVGRVETDRMENTGRVVRVRGQGTGCGEVASCASRGWSNEP